MNLIMLSGDTAAASGRAGAFTSTLEEFARHWERIDVLTPAAPTAGQRVLFGNVHFWPAAPPRLLQPVFIVRRGRQLAAQRNYALILSHDYGFFLNGIGAARLGAAIGVPYVSEIHHVEGFPQAASSGERVRRIAAGIYLRWARNRARAFRVVNSQELPALLHTHGIAAHKVRVLHLSERQLATSFKNLRELLTTHKAHRQKRNTVFLTRLIDRDYSWMLHPRRGLRLLSEPRTKRLILRKVLSDNLQRNIPTKLRIVGLIHHAHRTATDDAAHLVPREHRSLGKLSHDQPPIASQHCQTA